MGIPETQNARAWLAHDDLEGYRPKNAHVFPTVEKVAVASLAEVGEALYDLLSVLAPDGKFTGLLYITGETNTGKSIITRGLIYRYLEHLLTQTNPERPPHLVTFEDPIEKWFYPVEALDKEPFSNKKRLIDYTPREKGTDCRSLDECRTAALRQTPAVVFCGEIRDQGELATAIAFGGTGHFIVATGHAGSLVEAANKVLTAVGANDPVKRAIHLPKILAIIHLKRISEPFCFANRDLTTSAVVPTLYRRCPQGLQGFIADGLASLLPYCPASNLRTYDSTATAHATKGSAGTPHETKSAPDTKHGTLGRQYLIKLMLHPNQAPKKPIVTQELGVEWNQLALDESKSQAVWDKNWSDIRAFHAGSHSRSVARKGKPLWLACAEDDVYGA